MKIDIVCPQFFPSVGGIQIDVYNLAKGLVAQGDDVTVLTSNAVGVRTEKLPAEEVVNGVAVKRFPAIHVPGLPYLALTPGALAGIARRQPDVQHVLSFLPAFLTNMALAAGALRRRPTVMTPVYHPNRSRIYRNLLGRLVDVLFDRRLGLWTLRLADHVIAQTQAELRHYLSKGVRNTSVVPIGVDLEEHDCGPDRANSFARRHGLGERTLLFLGRVEPRKDLATLLRAMPAVVARCPNAELLLVGDRLDHHPEHLCLARELGIASRVRSAGRVPFEDIPAALEAVQVVTVPSIFEVTSRVVLEAWAHRKPVVATRGIGHAEIIGPDAGVVVESQDPRALGEALGALLCDQERARAMGQAGYERLLEGHLWPDIVKRTRMIYEEAALRRRN